MADTSTMAYLIIYIERVWFAKEKGFLKISEGFLQCGARLGRRKSYRIYV